MRFAIITIIDMTNYGNRLQNIALHNILSAYGETETLAISLEGRGCYFYKKIKNIIEMRYGYMLSSKGVKRVNNTIRQRQKNFLKFEKLGKIRFVRTESVEKMKDIFDEYDFCFVGSDQVWNPYFWNYENPEKLFSQFFLKGINSSKRIAVAASFGIEEIPKEWCYQFARELENFDSISVREVSGRKIVNDLIKRNASILVDPTLAVNNEIWEKALQMSALKIQPKEYILKYFLGQENAEYKKVIGKIAKENQLSIRALNDESDSEYYTAGPCEFLQCLKNAKLICTDSFHAVVFSIIFNKPFIVFPRNSKGVDMGDRITTLLSTFNLENRSYNNIKYSDIFYCDFTKSNEIVSYKRKEFIDFIEKAIHKM